MYKIPYVFLAALVVQVIIIAKKIIGVKMYCVVKVWHRCQRYVSK